MDFTPWLTKNEFGSLSADIQSASDFISGLVSGDWEFARLDDNNKLVPNVGDVSGESALCWNDQEKKWDVFTPGQGGSTDEKYWRPTVTEGIIEWNLESTTTTPESVDIKGKDGSEWTIGTDGYWYKDGVKTSNKAIGEDGKDGQGISISGSEDTYSEIEARASDEDIKAGDSYFCKADGLLYIYDGTSFPPSGDGIIFQGVEGKSAYEVAVETGYEGTEDEWIDSLKGDQGTPGKDGTAWTIGTDGYWYADDVKTDYVAIGKDGTNANLRIDKSAIAASEEHPNGGTKVTVTPIINNVNGQATTFDIWNGNDGTNGTDGIDGGGDYLPLSGGVVTGETTFEGGATFKSNDATIVPIVYEQDSWAAAMKFVYNDNAIQLGENDSQGFSVKSEYDNAQYDFSPLGDIYFHSDTENHHFVYSKETNPIELKITTDETQTATNTLTIVIEE